MNDEKNKFDVAVIGAGVMGAAIIDRLIATGRSVIACDQSPNAQASLIQRGISIVGTPALAACECACVILSLNHADIVEQVVFGKEGVIHASNGDILIIDMSSIDPGRTAEMAKRLKTLRPGARWLDCPLSGGVPAVEEGRLTVMAGGDEIDFERARPVMHLLCKNYTLMGANGAGQMTKLINQLFCGAGFQLIAEGVKLAESAGVKAEMIPKALQGGRADSTLLQEFFLKFYQRDFSLTGKIGNMMKDLNSLQSYALSQNLALPVTSQICDIHRLLCLRGLADKDSAEMITMLDESLPY